MASKIDRQIAKYTHLLLTNSLSTTEEIKFEDYACLTLFFPSDWTTATLTFYSLDPATGNYVALIDDAGNSVTFSSSASTARVCPDALFPSDKIKIVTNQAGNNAKVVGGVAKS
jgi:hypothetical protein